MGQELTGQHFKSICNLQPTDILASLTDIFGGELTFLWRTDILNGVTDTLAG